MLQMRSPTISFIHWHYYSVEVEIVGAAPWSDVRHAGPRIWYLSWSSLAHSPNTPFAALATAAAAIYAAISAAARIAMAADGLEPWYAMIAWGWGERECTGD
jgi:hypothetical protein